jgi:hypothetical protein
MKICSSGRHCYIPLEDESRNLHYSYDASLSMIELNGVCNKRSSRHARKYDLIAICCFLTVQHRGGSCNLV